MEQCAFCGKSQEDPPDTKVMQLGDKYYKCYCVTLEEYRKEHSETSA